MHHLLCPMHLAECTNYASDGFNYQRDFGILTCYSQMISITLSSRYWTTYNINGARDQLLFWLLHCDELCINSVSLDHKGLLYAGSSHCICRAPYWGSHWFTTLSLWFGNPESVKFLWVLWKITKVYCIIVSRAVLNFWPCHGGKNSNC